MSKAAKNEGQRLLRRATSSRGHAARLAESLGVDHAMVTKWRAGQRPLTNYRVKLLGALGIPLNAWDEPARSNKGAA